MTAKKWKDLLRALPKGLTFIEVSRRLGMPYQRVRLAIHRHRYRASDGRRFCCPRKIPVESIDWSESNASIARRFGVTRERIRVLRNREKKPFVESRGRKRG